jgi:CRP/FNR family transcriptional regulator
LFSESDTGRTLYLLVRGVVTLEKSSGEGTMFVAERRPGEYFGEMALFDNQPRSATAIAQTDCELLLLSQADFLECVRRFPQIALRIIGTLSTRLREADERSARRAGLSVGGRLAAYLLESAERAALKTADGHRALPRPSDREIGERIGATRESVNRRLADLDRNKILIRGERRITLLDEARLKRLAAGGEDAVDAGGSGSLR